MERKGVISTLAVTAEEVQTALPKARTLTSEEEKALRMRYGAHLSRSAPLPSAAGNNVELRDELLIFEMQLLAQSRARQGAMVAPRPAPSRAKEKIVRALRKKR